MNAALALASRKPEWRIAVVDALPLGGGGSTRNAGFTCFGSPSELLDDWRALGPEATVDLVRMRWEGLQALRAMWGDKALGHRACGAVEAFTDEALFEEVMAFLPELERGLGGRVSRHRLPRSTGRILHPARLVRPTAKPP